MFDSFTEFVSEMAEELSAFKEIISAAGLIVIDICAPVSYTHLTLPTIA